MSSGVGLEVVLRGRGAAPRRKPGEPFRVLLIGDFRGRADQASQEQATLAPPLRVDAVDFEKAFARFQPRLTVSSLAGASEELSLSSVEDLHPDRLFQNLALFGSARELRRALAAGTDQQVFERARNWLAKQNAVAALPAGSALTRSEAKPEAEDTTLARLLGGSRGPSQATGAPGAPSPAQALLERAVRPHVAPDVAAEKGPLLAAVDRAIGDEMTAILRSPGFRALEATWRSAERVVRSLDSDEELEVWLWDATRAELVTAFANAGSDLEASQVHALLVNGDRHFTVVASELTFAADDDDLTLLAQLAATVARGGGVLLADAAPSVLGARDVSGALEPRSWTEKPLPALGQALRASPLGRKLGLFFPRVLARRPYGKKRDPLAAFAFEEIAAGAFDAAERVWASAAFAAAELLGQRFRASGWGVDEGPLELTDLPLDTFEDRDGERQLVPCAEVRLPESAVAAFLERGVMPLLAPRDRAALRLPRLASFSDAAEALELAAADQ